MRSRICGLCVVFLLLLSVTSFAQGWQLAYTQEVLVDFQAVHFPSSSVGYAVGTGGAIYKSTDGGTSWSLQTSPVTLTLYDFDGNQTSIDLPEAFAVLFTQADSSRGVSVWKARIRRDISAGDWDRSA